MNYRKNVLRGLGFEFGDENAGVQVDGPGNEAWQRAQRLAVETNAKKARRR